MRRWDKIALGVGLGLAVTALLLLLLSARPPAVLTGVVLRQNADPRNQVPVAGVEVTAANGLALHAAKTDATGLFRLRLRFRLKWLQPVVLMLRHPDYIPLNVAVPAGRMLYVVRISPTASSAEKTVVRGPPTLIRDLSIRYTIAQSTAEQIGSAAKIFVVNNTANIACEKQAPCSPDGRWKAAAAAMSLDAGKGNRFRDPVVSCIAGPCPFTKIDSKGITKDGQIFHASVRDWSDPATFLMQAEVMHPTTGELVRQFYPAILGRTLYFTLPKEAEGVSFEAELNGNQIVFPLGAELCVSWAECSEKVGKDGTSSYRCELKPGFAFH